MWRIKIAFYLTVHIMFVLKIQVLKDTVLKKYSKLLKEEQFLFIGDIIYLKKI